MHNVDFDLIDMDLVNGAAGVYEIVADEAQKFADFHNEEIYNLPENHHLKDCYWDANDWYETSDKYFSDVIADQLYAVQGEG
jgi:hypothetical protein